MTNAPPSQETHMSTHADPSKDEYLEVEKKLGAAELELAANLADAEKTLDAGVEKRKKRVSAAGLQDGDAVPVIAVTGTAANVAGIVGGIIVFGDPLAGNPLLLAVECVAFVLVIAAAWLMPAPVRAASAAV